jgi:hypothetical protein
VPDLLQARLAIAPDALFQDLEGETVIFYQEQYFSLGDVAAKVWAWIAGHGDLDGLFATLLGEYEVEEATLRQDVKALLDEMIDKGLIIKGA